MGSLTARSSVSVMVSAAGSGAGESMAGADSTETVIGGVGASAFGVGCGPTVSPASAELLVDPQIGQSSQVHRQFAASGSIGMTQPQSHGHAVPGTFAVGSSPMSPSVSSAPPPGTSMSPSMSGSIVARHLTAPSIAALPIRSRSAGSTTYEDTDTDTGPLVSET